MKAAHDEGAMVLIAGTDVLRLAPSLVITEEETRRSGCSGESRGKTGDSIQGGLKKRYVLKFGGLCHRQDRHHQDGFWNFHDGKNQTQRLDL